MAINILPGERIVQSLRESVEGTSNEIVLTDQAVYIEAEKPGSSI